MPRTFGSPGDTGWDGTLPAPKAAPGPHKHPIPALGGIGSVPGAAPPVGAVLTVTVAPSDAGANDGQAAFQPPPAVAAADVATADAGGYFTATDQEGVDQEIGAEISDHEARIDDLETGGTLGEGGLTDLLHGRRHAFVATGFVASDESLYVQVSDDGKTWTALYEDVFNPGTEFVRDPALLFHEGSWWLCHTRGPAGGAFGTTDSFGVAISDGGSAWTEVADVSLTAIGGINRAWAPQWFVDENGAIHVFIAVSADGGGSFNIYEIHPTNAGMTSWSTPVDVGIGSNYIDPFIVRKGQFYYLWVKNETTKYIEVFRSASLTSGYTAWKTGNWAGWGSELEGESLVRVDAHTWRIYMDAYGPGILYWSESTDDWATWSAKVAVNAPYFLRHPDVHHAYAPKEPWEIADGERDGTTFLRDDMRWATPETVGALDDLSDVDAAAPSVGDMLRWDGSAWASAAATTPDAFVVDAGTPTYDDADPDGVAVAVSAQWGIDGSGDPYFNSTGVTSGDEAALIRNPTTGEYLLRSYSF